jgi:alpha/beta superfamily hydrolase
MDTTAGNPSPARPAAGPPTVDELILATEDGHRLTGELAAPAGAVAVAVLCHPHPDYGGDRFNAVIAALFRTLPDVGIAALRFDFRRPIDGGGIGRAPLDVAAALAEASDRSPGHPAFLVGYSFGAAAALATAAGRDDVAALVAIAPPLALLPAPPPPVVPTLVLVPAHDQFSPPDAVAPVVGTWPAARQETIDAADHFLAGRTHGVAERVAAWLGERVDR